MFELHLLRQQPHFEKILQQAMKDEAAPSPQQPHQHGRNISAKALSNDAKPTESVIDPLLPPLLECDIAGPPFVDSTPPTTPHRSSPSSTHRGFPGLNGHWLNHVQQHTVPMQVQALGSQQGMASDDRLHMASWHLQSRGAFKLVQPQPPQQQYQHHHARLSTSSSSILCPKLCQNGSAWAFCAFSTCSVALKAFSAPSAEVFDVG
mmetsp:Transcript_120183/g.256482  ORF Transcript_120183/g.256482 Transcript_120183/m.256482 type:complete len:206 (-) Transcript_120183:241-858(-)